MDEGEALLDWILENTPPLEPIQVEPLLWHEEASLAKLSFHLPKKNRYLNLKTQKKILSP
jgi:hypothetical protein